VTNPRTYTPHYDQRQPGLIRGYSMAPHPLCPKLDALGLPWWATESGDVLLVQGDCLEVLPLVEAGSVDAVVTDPPYGTGWVRGGGGVGEFNAKHERPEWDVWDVSWMTKLVCDSWAVFCPLSRARDIRGVSCYYRKTNPRPGGPTREAVVVNPEPWKAAQWEYSAYNGDCPLHPCQKPDELMEWAVSLVDAETILDPFMGSGTTGIACLRTGRRFIGVEKEPKYYAIACDRIRRELNRTALLEPPPRVVQSELFT
jgi:site-specific DNA-methyltransferase (adenine-specific)